MLIQTRIVIRLMMFILFPIGLFCLIALAIGTANPTQWVSAITYLPTQNISRITIFDMNRNLPIHIPTSYVQLPEQGNAPVISLSPDGRRVLLIYGLMSPNLDAPRSSFVWDIFSGDFAEIPPCDMFQPTWLPDSRRVAYTCYGGLTQGTYFFDFETRQSIVTPLIMMDMMSPDGQYVVITGRVSMSVASLDRSYEQPVTPPNMWASFIGWESDSQSLLIQGVKNIQRYTLPTNTLEILAEELNISNYQPMKISPDNQWLSLSLGLSNPKPHILHLPTATVYDLSVFGDDVIQPESLVWSPDSQWLIMIGYSRGERVYYLTRPDKSEFVLLHRTNMQFNQRLAKWSSDSQWITFSEDSTGYLHIWRWDEAKAQFTVFKVIEQLIFAEQWLTPDKLGFVVAQDKDTMKSYLAYFDIATGEIHRISYPPNLVVEYHFLER